MSILLGESINIGVGIENPSARGVAVAPQGFIAGRTPAGVNVEVTKTLIKETAGKGIVSQGSEVVQKKALGSLEFNLKSETIGYLLKSLLGKCTTTTVLGSVKSHKFEVLQNNPQFPTLTLALSQTSNFQDYEYRNALVKQLEISTPVDDLVNATAEFIAVDEEEQSTFDVSFSETDYIFKPQDVQIKLADNVDDLEEAEPINVKEFSISINNNAKEQQHIGSLTPTDNIAGLIEITGELLIDYEDTTYHDYYKDGSYKVMQIIIENKDVEYDEAGNTPKLTITLATISFEGLEVDRPLDDIVKEKLTFNAHYSAEEDEAINIVLQNTVADYDYEPIS